MDRFVHLHNHTMYSPLDGMIRPAELVQRAAKLGQRAVAVTDHGLMGALPQFYMEAKKHDVIPILGQEFYITPDAQDKSHRNNFHIVLLALDETGYRLLAELSSIANQPENFYYDARIDHAILKHYRRKLRNHVACLSGCLSSELQRAIAAGKPVESVA